jgi:ABC-type multidrug transport system ATPase subunit
VTRATTPAVEVAGLRKVFGDTVALDGIDLYVDAGTIFALLGPNGAGKTTTVHVLSTLIAPDAGEARVAGHDVAREPDAVRAAIGVTGQFSAVDGLLTGERIWRSWPTCITCRATMPVAASPVWSSGSISSRPRARRPSLTRAACAGASTSR